MVEVAKHSIALLRFGRERRLPGMRSPLRTR
jgi:hypothetical protein